MIPPGDHLELLIKEHANRGRKLVNVLQRRRETEQLLAQAQTSLKTASTTEENNSLLRTITRAEQLLQRLQTLQDWEVELAERLLTRFAPQTPLTEWLDPLKRWHLFQIMHSWDSERSKELNTT